MCPSRQGHQPVFDGHVISALGVVGLRGTPSTYHLCTPRSSSSAAYPSIRADMPPPARDGHRPSGECSFQKHRPWASASFSQRGSESVMQYVMPPMVSGVCSLVLLELLQPFLLRIYSMAGETDCGQASRAISTARLHMLPCFHLPPINVIVSHGPSGDLRPGSAHLGVGFPLRCFQRLSLPNVATRRCPWRNNRYTRGWSIPVLSY